MTNDDGVVGDVELPLATERLSLGGGYDEGDGQGVSVAQLEQVATTLPGTSVASDKNYTM